MLRTSKKEIKKLHSHSDDIPHKCTLGHVHKKRIATEIAFTVHKGCLQQRLSICVTSQAMACSSDRLYKTWMSCSKQMILHKRKILFQPENRTERQNILLLKLYL